MGWRNGCGSRLSPRLAIGATAGHPEVGEEAARCMLSDSLWCYAGHFAQNRDQWANASAWLLRWLASSSAGGGQPASGSVRVACSTCIKEAV
jgi:hypothetical protein